MLLGITTSADLLRMAEIGDRPGAFDSLWVGDSLLAKPRLEAMVLLAALAARTSRARLGVACLASMVLRDPVLLATQWASLDLLANGRTVLIACTGIVPQEGGRIEGDLYKVKSRDRVERLTEWITILKRLWTEDNVSFAGRHYNFSGVTILPKPAAKPRPPIWIANNAGGERSVIERTHRRVAEHADGWETALSEPDDVAWRIEDVRTKVREAGRDPAEVETHLYHNINVNRDRNAARTETKRFLDAYYEQDHDSRRVETWTAAGSPDDCVEHLRVFSKMGFHEITLRITSWDQFGQLERVINEVIPRMRNL